MKNDNFEMGKGIYRVTVRNLSLMYVSDKDELMVGFLNADKLTKKDLEDIHRATGNILNMINNEKQ